MTNPGPHSAPSIAWVTRSFLDYRVPVFRHLSELAEGKLTVIFSGDYVPERVQAVAREVLGDRAIALRGEWKWGAEDRRFMANRNLSLRLQPGLGRCLRRHQPDVMIGDGFFKWTWQALMHRRRHGTPLVVAYERTAHTERSAQAWRRWYRKWVLRRTDAVACSGSLCADYVASLGFPPERVVRGHIAADTPFFESQSREVTVEAVRELRERFGVRGMLYLAVGRLVAGKGCHELLAAWRRFEHEHRGQATLMWVGSGEERDNLGTACARDGLEHVCFAGEVPYRELARFYRAADVLVMPTLEDNWSLVVPEAMACGCPVLCSRYNGCWPELIGEHGTGQVFDPLAEEAFSQALAWPLEHAAQLPAMGERAREHARGFGPEAAAASLFEACRLALQRRAPERRL